MVVDSDDVIDDVGPAEWLGAEAMRAFGYEEVPKTIWLSDSSSVEVAAV